MRGEFLFLVVLDLFLPCFVPDYCLVYIVGIRALYSILPGAGAELVDPGLLEPAGPREPLEPGNGPPTDRTCNSVDSPAYGANIHLVKVQHLYILWTCSAPSVGRETPQL